MPFESELSEVFAAQSDATLEGIRKCAVGVVTAVKGQFVDVQLGTNSPLFDDQGKTSFEPAPVLGSVPLCALRGGGMLVWIPVAVGDSVMVFFTDLSADTWRTGNGQNPVNPGWCGRHTADSPFAVPWIAPDAPGLSSARAGSLVIGKDQGPAQIVFNGSTIQLGGAGGDAIALASKVDAFIQAVMTWVPVPNDGGAALKTALVSAGFSTTSTTKSTLVTAQ